MDFPRLSRPLLPAFFLIAAMHTVLAQEITLLVQVNDAGHHLLLDSLQHNLTVRRLSKNREVQTPGKIQVERVFRYAGKHEPKHKKYGLDRWYRVRFQAGSVDSLKLTNWLSREAQVHWESPKFAEGDVAPTDSLFNKQWSFHNTGQTRGRPGADISAINAMRIEQGDPRVVVSIHDSGIDFNHPDLVANLWKNPGEIPDNGVDDDDNGFIDDVHGWNFQANTNNLQDTDGHGTHIAGVIAAKANDKGVTGIAGGSTPDSGVRLMICRLDDDALGLRIIKPEESIVYAADNGANISQNSWGTFGFSFEVKLAIQYFANEAQNSMMDGGVVVFSSGNNGSTAHRYESENPNVMMVGNTTHDDVLAYTSNFGSWMALCAPGTDIYSNHLQGSWRLLSGTSMAAPHVSGVAGLVVSKFGHPGYTPDSVISRIRSAADNIDAFNPGRVGMLGSGRLNAFRSLIDDDHAGPSPIDTVLISEIRSQDAVIKWVAPQDDLWSAFRYKITIRSTTEDHLREVPVRIPEAGDTITLHMDGLTPATEYTISIVAFDYFGNASIPSTDVSLVTTEKPEISVSSFKTFHAIPRDSSYVTEFEITNSGVGELDWHLSGQHPDSLIMAGVRIRAMNYWTYYETILHAMALGGKASELTVPVQEGLDLLGTHVILLDDQIRLIDSAQLVTIADWVADGGSLIMMADSPDEIAKANVLANMFGIRVMKYPQIRAFILEPQPSDHELLYDIMKLNAMDCGTYLEPLDGVSFGSLVTVLKDIDNNAHVVAGKFGKGRILFAANRVLQSYGIGDSDNLRLAKNIIRWLARDPVARFEVESGSLKYGEHETIRMSFSHNLRNPFSGTIYLTSNDPAQPFTELNYLIDFIGKPVIKVVESMAFETTYTGYERVKQLVIKNVGTDTLFATVGAGDSFTTLDPEVTIAPGEVDAVDVVFHPQTSGEHTSILSISPLGFDSSHVVLKGSAIDPPKMIVFPLDTLKVYVPIGQKVHRRVYVQNLGESTALDFTVDVERTGSPGAASSIAFEGKVIAFATPGLYQGTVSLISWKNNELRPFSLSELDELDVLLLDFHLNTLDEASILAIREWVAGGGNLLLNLEQISNHANVSKLLSGTIFRSIGSYSPSYHDTLNITSVHAITEGVEKFRLRNASTYFTVEDSLKVLVRDRFQNTLLAYDTFGEGRIVMASGHLLSNDAVDFQNTELVTQCFNWLINGTSAWLSIMNFENDVSPEASIEIPLVFENTAEEDRSANIQFRTNDPANPFLQIPVHMVTESFSREINHLPVIVKDTIRVLENSRNGLKVFKSQAVDQDGDVVRWFAHAPFISIDEVGAITIADSAYFDFESGYPTAIELGATDGIDTTSSSIPIEVINVNEKPNIEVAVNSTMLEDGELYVPVSYLDPEGDDVMFSFEILENSIIIDDPVVWDDGSLRFKPDQNKFGEVRYRVKAGDGSLIDSIDCVVAVTPINDPPELSDLEDQVVSSGSELKVNFTVTDVDNDLLEISIFPADQSIFAGRSFVVEKDLDNITVADDFSLVRNGITTVTISASDSESTIEKSFSLDVSTVTNLRGEVGQRVSVFPNPVESEVLIELSGDLIETLTVFDGRGNIVKQIKGFGSVAVRLLVDDLSPGFYVLQIASRKKTLIPVKITIQR